MRIALISDLHGNMVALRAVLARIQSERVDRVARLRMQLKRLVLPPRRFERSYPRAVKVKMSNYPRKRPSTQVAK